MERLLRPSNKRTLPSELAIKLQRLLPDFTCRSAQRMVLGLSNDNYHIVGQQGESFLLKCYSTVVPGRALKLQKDLAQAGFKVQGLKVYCEQNKLAIFDFIPTSNQPLSVTDELLKSLSDMHRFLPSMPLLQLQLDQHISLISVGLQKKYQSALDWAMANIKSYPDNIGVCHNDLVKENLLSTYQGTYLIDFEYAAVNDVFFDLAAITCSFRLSLDDCRKMLQQYFAIREEAQPGYAIEKLRAFQVVYLLLSVDWYYKRKELNRSAPLIEYLQNVIAYIPPKR